jgi:hypothetical protein
MAAFSLVAFKGAASVQNAHLPNAGANIRLSARDGAIGAADYARVVDAHVGRWQVCGLLFAFALRSADEYVGPIAGNLARPCAAHGWPARAISTPPSRPSATFAGQFNAVIPCLRLGIRQEHQRLETFLESSARSRGALRLLHCSE